jgi:glycosyltransferase involved in cell wall biosynthesis
MPKQPLQQLPPFSTLMVTYGGDDAGHLFAALESLANQTLKAQETVLVCAGPMSKDHNEAIGEFTGALQIKRINLWQNRPLAFSLNVGLRAASNDWVARMDADDIAHPDRFKTQFEYLQNHPEIDVIGTTISEFVSDPGAVMALRTVPTTHNTIARRAFLRTPFNHVSVVYKKSKVLGVGGYRLVLGYEDFDLWTRMLVRGAQMANLEKTLVFVRVGNGFHQRRGGLAYAKAEWYALHTANAINTINPWAVRVSMGPRFLMRLLPSAMRNQVYRLARHRP